MIKKLFLLLRQAQGSASLRQQLSPLLQKQNKSKHNPVDGRQVPDPYLALWLESKVKQQTIQALIQQRFQHHTRHISSTPATALNSPK